MKKIATILIVCLFSFSIVSAASFAATGIPGTPNLYHNNYDGLSNYTITMNMWWGNNGTSWVLYENNAVILTQTLVDNSPDAQTASFNITGKQNGSYSYRCDLRNSFGTTNSKTITVNVTNGGSGTNVPAIPTGLSALASGTSQINVSWNAVTGAASYDLEVDGNIIANASSPYAHSGLGAGTTHNYRVRAKNANGSSAFSSIVSATTETGGSTSIYNIYYGNIHNHTAISDGSGTPDQAYNYAKNVSKLDFFSIADHSGGLTGSNWTETKTAADKYNQDGVFASFWGFEWTSSTLGHVAIINSPDYCSTGSVSSFPALVTWVSTRDCLAFFNHPGRQDSTGQEFSHFATTASDRFVGMELWNKNDGFMEYYYNDGYYRNDGNKSYFDEANSRGWKIGAAGAEDNHTANWGNYTNFRTAVLATAKTRAAIYDALKARRFFSTLDKNIKMYFEFSGNQMGAVVNAGTYNAVIKLSDGDGETFSSVELIKNGILANTWNPNSGTPEISQSISASSGDYFYVRVKQPDGGEAVSSPIFIR